ncbi:hypothetical protein FCV25MIE_08072, partial [Fagus crenata]
MGVNEKRKFSMEILVILFIMNTILFRATSMEVSNTTYPCNGSVHECRVVEPETKRMLEAGSNNYPSIDAVLTSTKPAVVCDRSGNSYDSCLPGKKIIIPNKNTAIYTNALGTNRDIPSTYCSASISSP